MLKLIAAFGAAILALTIGSLAQAQTSFNPNGVDPEHYQCYPISQPGQFAPRSVTLRDQFGFRQVRVAAPRLLCAPVSKNNGVLADTRSHLVCYVIFNGQAANKRVEVFNQFGRLQFNVGTGTYLCVPSFKRVLPTTPG